MRAGIQFGGDRFFSLTAQEIANCLFHVDAIAATYFEHVSPFLLSPIWDSRRIVEWRIKGEKGGN
ncbi:hypothetical protein [Bradyrhizobium zhanjiangense]|uniref:hypothetical protein n=1 Tax=Bradyrhizobium zhanjiangense TaxID=1325107 RepID=UPI0013E89DF9|nr:hypothetical protein [Bradyrhizobium zhanjiangense]